ncbi:MULTISPECIES: DUF1259 domain-containing protein [Streptomycetaceae]|uniref:Lipoprotein n=1 Tax=Streptantibioticus cattleyicolor (strain ATCC 35852 / DSM 46488 / JCM 4925 / NBRC 14057 / NRRL 8057) TaxID=1003195 RepID=F8K197_STREN|nr:MULTISPECIES: DUF1259 domain-containing protein [Streptomycetaceae]AEW96170.1 lipoprotein [Streptantibioticus cattleyicolor NRRL 8057 = DSM 46488]MYS60694.1 DUF1259 domain-containing protein [Streptomyces sp. SID5468]CCB76506.1 conserved exported protein of unknown function [Streptantibioticus cattleyicolor NRRL 8057 = DSM 46488]
MPAIRSGRNGHRLRASVALTTCAVTLTACAAQGAGTGTSAGDGHPGPPAPRGAHRHRAHCPHVQYPERTKDADWKGVAEALGRTGTTREDVAFGVSLPRRDLKVTSHGVTVLSSLALAGSAAFVRYCDGTMLMGDLVLTGDEVDKASDALQAAGIDQTALHKHLPDEQPAIWWTHFHAMGDPVTLARKLKTVLEVSGNPIAVPPPAETRPIDLDTTTIDRELGRKGVAEGRIYKFFLSRRDRILSHGHVLPGPIGVNTAIKFQAIGKKQAAINGDFVLRADEVQPVVRALRKHGIRLVELHNHMLDEQPRMFFLHFWAVGDGNELARALRPALDATDLAPASANAPAPADGGPE